MEAKHKKSFLDIWKNRIDLFFSYLKFNMSASMEYRTSFLIQIFGMFLNNASFAFFWWILFEKVGSINGFSYSQVMTLWAFASVSFGITVVVFGNLHRLVEIIVRGELDSYLLQPRNVLANVLMSSSSVSGWGDIIYGFVLFFILFGLDIGKLLLFIAFSILGSILFMSVVVTAASLSFFIGSFQSVASWMMDFLISFSIYPETIYYGMIKVILFTLLPSGLLTMLPTDLIYRFSFIKCLYLIGGIAIWFAVSQYIFSRGLKRYESGNLIVQKQ